MHGFCYQLIRVEASGSRDQAVALVRRPQPSRAGFIQAAGEMENPAIRSYVDELRAPSPALAPIIDLRGRGSWHGSDRLDGTVRARESGQVLDIGPLGPGCEPIEF